MCRDRCRLNRNIPYVCSYSYKNTWGMSIYQITIRNAPHNNVEEYSFYKNPQNYNTNTPRFCDRNSFSPCFNGIPHFKKSSNANRKRNRFIRPRRNLPVSFCESAITIHHHRRGLQGERIKFDIRGFASKNTRPSFPVSLIPVSSIKQNAAISNSNRGDSVFLSYEL